MFTLIKFFSLLMYSYFVTIFVMNIHNVLLGCLFMLVNLYVFNRTRINIILEKEGEN